MIDRLGLTVTGQHLGTDHTVLAYQVVEPEEVAERFCWCTRCGELGVPRDTVVRRLAHAPVGWRPTVLDVTLRRFRCPGFGDVWRQDTTAAAAPRAKLTRAAVLAAAKGRSPLTAAALHDTQGYLETGKERSAHPPPTRARC